MIKLKEKLNKFKHGAEYESYMYTSIFELEDKIKEKERAIELRERALKNLDTAMKK
jgi:hypothetical protein